MRFPSIFGPLLVVLVLFLTPLCAADASSDLTWWQQILIGIFGLVSTVVTAMLVPYLRSKAAAANAIAEDAAMTTRQRLVERLKGYLWGQAAAISERDFPIIAKEIIAGNLKTAEQVKGVLRGLGENLKNDAIAYFKTQGIDLIETFGEKFVDDLIRRAADSVSPFPGKETAVALLQDGAHKLLEYGVHRAADSIKPTTVPGTLVTPNSALKPLGG